MLRERRLHSIRSSKLLIGTLLVILGGVSSIGGAGTDEAAQAAQGPELAAAYLHVSRTKAEVGDTILITAIVANVGAEAAKNVNIGPASTTREFETLAKEPPLPIASLEPGQSVGFTAVVRFSERGEFELGISAVADNAILSPQTRPVVVYEGQSSRLTRLAPWLAIPASLVLGATLLFANRWRRWRGKREVFP